MGVTSTYSGIVLEQNAQATGLLDWRGEYNSQAFYQTFYLPSSYVLGTTDTELRVPNLSGLQVMVHIDEGYAATATLSYTLDYFIPGSGWANLISGQTIGNHTDGRCWMNLIFPKAVETNATIASSLLRLGIVTTPAINDAIQESVVTVAPGTYLVENQTIYTSTLVPEEPFPVDVNGRPGFLINHQGTVSFSAQQGVDGLYYTEASALAPAGGFYEVDKATFAVDGGASMNFRVLSLVADFGTSFLGNEYRSCVLLQDGAGTDTGTSFWQSTPQPSPFAVVSRYFDLRPSPSTQPFGEINLVPNPSFEHDFLSTQTPAGWLEYDNTSTRNNFQVVDTWAYSGDQSLRSTNTFTSQAGAYGGVAAPNYGGLGLHVSADKTYSCQAEINLLSLPAGSQGLQVSILWYNVSGSPLVTTQLATTNGPTLTATGLGTLAITNAVPPATATNATLIFWSSTGATGVLDFEIDAVQFTESALQEPYGDGDSPGWDWTGRQGNSPSGNLLDTITNTSVVIDGVLVDPSTPNMAFNVYYSNDDTNNSDNMTELDWEGKLWSRVPQVYIATQRQQYAFPEPVSAKYMKMEFCNLNAQTYTPGSFPLPVTYKKMPTWVADYFITQLELPGFTANAVIVQNDALTLAYDYYLDDLGQSPADPGVIPPTTAQLTSYFQTSDAGNYVDPVTLRRINLIMQSYKVPTGSIVDPTTLLGLAAQTITNNITNSAGFTSEVSTVTAANVSTVSTLSRSSIVFEQSLPVMFFFLTCRHGYKEVAANFETDKAYFAGTNDIEFLRSNYNIVSDQELYIESGVDTFNAFRNDFVLDDDGDWYTS
jgi:hypothetical protein